MSREDLIRILEDGADGDLVADPVDEEREAMWRMQEEGEKNGIDIRQQLKWCTNEGHACWDCPPAKAVACAREECDPALLDEVKRGMKHGKW